MKEIDWLKVAGEYELTVDELQNQVFAAAAIMGEMDNDALGAAKMTYSCEDDEGPIYLTVSRIKPEATT